MFCCSSTKSVVSPQQNAQGAALQLLSEVFDKALNLNESNNKFVGKKYLQNKATFMQWVDLLKSAARQSSCFNINHLKNIIIALRHDEISLNIDAFEQWLINNEPEIKAACKQIRAHGHLAVEAQSSDLNAMHHTKVHGLDVITRAKHLYKHLNLSSSNSARDAAYTAIRELMVELHDLVQTAPFGAVPTNEELTKDQLFFQLSKKLNLTKHATFEVHTFLSIMAHRLIVLGTSLVFGERLFDLSEMYIKSRRIFNIESPFEALNKEMLIVGIADKSPAYCHELVSMLKNNAFNMMSIAYNTLSNEQSLLINFLQQADTIKIHTDFDLNLLSTLIALSPHIGMSIELKTLTQTKEQALRRERQVLTYNTQLSNKTNDIAQNTQKEKIEQISQSLNNNDEARLLQQYICDLKFGVWHGNSSRAPNIRFYKNNSQQFLNSTNILDIQRLKAFENIFIKSLINESHFSNKQRDILIFLSAEFDGALNISMDAAEADANNLLKLKDFYESLPKHQKIQLMHELLFPLVFQLGEFVSKAMTSQYSAEKDENSQLAHRTPFWQPLEPPETAITTIQASSLSLDAHY